jgi:hypothetical protein
MAIELRTSDKAVARLVLFILADAPAALTRVEIYELTPGSDRQVVDRVLDELREAGVLIVRADADIWAISANVAGVERWAERSGDEAFAEREIPPSELAPTFYHSTFEEHLSSLSKLKLDDSTIIGLVVNEDVRNRASDSLEDYLRQLGSESEAFEMLMEITREGIPDPKIAAFWLRLLREGWPSSVPQDAQESGASWLRNSGISGAPLVSSLANLLAGARPENAPPLGLAAVARVSDVVKSIYDVMGPPPGWRRDAKGSSGDT